MCKQCGNEIVGRRRNVIYCSIKCKQRAQDAKRIGRSFTEEEKARRRNARLIRTYGINSVEWTALFKSQNEACAVCKRTESTGKGWHTDHCHTTGKVRGILCHECNVMLGHARDEVTTLLAAVEYLNAA